MVPVTTYGPFGLASIVTSAMTILPSRSLYIISERVLGCMVLMLEKGDKMADPGSAPKAAPILVTKLVGVHAAPTPVWRASIAVDVDH
jgi:hypothetical protein